MAGGPRIRACNSFRGICGACACCIVTPSNSLPGPPPVPGAGPSPATISADVLAVAARTAPAEEAAGVSLRTTMPDFSISPTTSTRIPAHSVSMARTSDFKRLLKTCRGTILSCAFAPGCTGGWRICCAAGPISERHLTGIVLGRGGRKGGDGSGRGRRCALQLPCPPLRNRDAAEACRAPSPPERTAAQPIGTPDVRWLGMKGCSPQLAEQKLSPALLSRDNIKLRRRR